MASDDEPFKEKVKNCVLGNFFTLLMLIGVFLGIIFGSILRSSRSTRWSERDIMYVEFIGQIFLQILKALVLPLLFSSIVSAIGCLDLRLCGRIGARAMCYFLSTTIIAVFLGLILCVSIEPGKAGAVKLKEDKPPHNVTTEDTLLDLIRNMFPPNIIQACISQYQTVLRHPQDSELEIDYENVELDLRKPWEKLTEKIRKYETLSNGNNTVESAEYDELTITEFSSQMTTPTPTGKTKNISLYDWKIEHEFTEGTNILGLVVFAVVLGATLSKMGEEGKPLLNVFNCLGNAMIIITNWVVWLSPIGVFFLVSGEILYMKSIEIVLGEMGMYTLTVLLGLFIHGFFILPIIFTVITKTLPFKFLRNVAEAIATAFGTASSNATLPISLQCLEEYNELDPRVTRFVMPIGATINKDGTALFEAVAALFIAQVNSVHLSFGQILIVSITATAASIGAAGIPQAGQITMVMVLDSIGLPSKEIARILVVDWLLDRFRTMVNVVGDALGAGIVHHLSWNELHKKREVKMTGVANPQVHYTH